ncbi:MAG: hypothetical protein LIR50_06965 [Bacillota bacterium]|nr:hypothetical protein [Bacillota bacterium]
MYRTSAERRHNDWTKAIRKRNICHEAYRWEYYDNLHQYSKNKIHCSCPMCSAKTNGNILWRAGGRHQGKNYCIKDLKRIEEMIYEIEELKESA